MARPSLEPVQHEGKVAQILSEHELVINLGARDGVSQGMRFAVMAMIPTEVKDPDTGEVLGTVEREKVRVEVVELQERLAVCRPYRGEGFRFPSAFDVLLGSRSDALKIVDDSLPQPLSPAESYVKVGDRVKELPGDQVPVRRTGTG